MNGETFTSTMSREYRWIHLPLSADPPGAEWKRNVSRDSWTRLVPNEDIESMFYVSTTAMLGDTEVKVTDVDPVAETALATALHPEYSSINDQSLAPPHPLLRAVPDPPYRLEWSGTVSWSDLSNVCERVGKVDPITGAGIPNELM